MQKLSVQDIIEKINAEEVFSAVSDDYSFTLKVDQYVPYICGVYLKKKSFLKTRTFLHSARNQ